MSDHDDLVRRIEELEAEVRSLRAQPERQPPARPAEKAVSRRRMLRGVGLAAAGATGALASPALTGQAAAADNDSLTIGAANDGNSATSLTRNTGTGPTLDLRNNGDGAPIRLTQTDPTTVGAGDVFLDSGGYFWGAYDTDVVGVVHESSYASYPLLLPPFRILDTRFASATSTNFGRSRVTDGAGKFDGAGRLKAGSSIDLRLDDIGELSLGLMANLTVTGGAGNGYLRAWPTTSDAPEASVINYVQGQSIANAVTLPIGFDTSLRDSITIDANQSNVHVIVDLAGVIVADPFGLDLGFLSAGAGLGPAAVGTSPRPSRRTARRPS